MGTYTIQGFTILSNQNKGDIEIFVFYKWFTGNYR